MKRQGALRVTLTAIIIVLLGSFAAATLVATIFRLQYEFNLDNAESLTVVNAYYLWHGKGLYGDINEFPYIITTYTPLYYLLIAPFSKDFCRIVFTGRLISLACFIAIGAMVFSSVRHRVGGVAIPAISCGFLFSSYVFYNDSSLAQINLLGLCLSVLGVWLLSERKNKCLALVVFLLAFYTKQTLISGVCAASIWIGLNERPARGFYYFFLFCFFSGLIFVVINVVTDGRFLLHTVKYNVNPMNLKYGFFAYFNFFRHYSVLLVISLLGLSWRKPGVWQLYLVVGLLWAATVAKEGAGHIYFAAPLLGLLVSSGFALGRLRAAGGWGYSIIAALIIVQTTMACPEYCRRLRAGLRLPDVEEQLCELSDMVRASDGQVLTETADLSFLNGKEYIYNGPDPRINEGGAFLLYKPLEVIRDIEKRRFSLIAECFIFRKDPELMKLIGEYYYKADKSYPQPYWGRRCTVWLPREEGG